MASYIVMEPPTAAGPGGSDAVRLIRDAFSAPAFILSPLWLLWHRLWIEAAIVFAFGLVLVELASWLGLGAGGSALSLLLSLFVGLEGQNLRIAALTRRGWHAWGVVDAASSADAFTHYALAATEGDEAAQSPRASPSPTPAFWPSSAPRTGQGPALGLLGYPGGR